MAETMLPEELRLALAAEARLIFGPIAAAQLWIKLGLPVTPTIRSLTKGNPSDE